MQRLFCSVQRQSVFQSRFTARFLSSGSDQYDVVIVGGGPGGYAAAIKAGQLGFKTACVEARGSLGGTCLNVGCIPSKALLHATHLYEQARTEFDHFGIKVSDVSVDLKKLMQHKNKTVTGLTKGIEGLFKKNNVDYVKGFGKLVGPNKINVDLVDGGNTQLDSKNIIVAVGSEVTPLPPCPVNNEEQRIVDSTGALSLSKVPEKLAVIGGGVIGLEMGSVWRRLGSNVTVFEFMDRIVPGTDLEITKLYQKILAKQGLKFKLSTKVTSSAVEGDGVSLSFEASKGGDSATEKFDVVLVSTGRRPFTRNIGLEQLGIELDNIGRITVNDHLQTAVPSIYAIGDCVRGAMLAHKAEEEGIACIEIIAGHGGHVNYDAIPNVIYTFPELATVGKTEEQAKELGIKYRKGTFPFLANSRARANAETDGMVKIIAEEETDKILGIHIVGPNAGEMIAEGVLGMEYGASSEDIGRTCHAHPTLSEAFKEAAMAVYDKPIHF